MDSLDRKMDSLSGSFSNFKLTYKTANVTFTNGITTYSGDISAYGSRAYAVIVNGIGTNSTFSTSITNAGANNVSVRIQCVNNDTLNAVQNVALTFLVK